MQHPTTNGLRILEFLLTPMRKIEDLSMTTKLCGVAAGMCQFILADVFNGFILLLMLASCYDFFLGYQVAKINGEAWSWAKARTGFNRKTSAIVLLCFIRIAEHLFTAYQIADGRGFLAGGIVVVLFGQEIGSIQAKRRELGAGDIPLLTTFLSFLSRIATARIPGGSTTATAIQDEGKAQS